MKTGDLVVRVNDVNWFENSSSLKGAGPHRISKVKGDSLNFSGDSSPFNWLKAYFRLAIDEEIAAMPIKAGDWVIRDKHLLIYEKYGGEEGIHQVTRVDKKNNFLYLGNGRSWCLENFSHANAEEYRNKEKGIMDCDCISFGDDYKNHHNNGKKVKLEACPLCKKKSRLNGGKKIYYFDECLCRVCIILKKAKDQPLEDSRDELSIDVDKSLEKLQTALQEEQQIRMALVERVETLEAQPPVEEHPIHYDRLTGERVGIDVTKPLDKGLHDGERYYYEGRRLKDKRRQAVCRAYPETLTTVKPTPDVSYTGSGDNFTVKEGDEVIYESRVTWNEGFAIGNDISFTGLKRWLVLLFLTSNFFGILIGLSL